MPFWATSSVVLKKHASYNVTACYQRHEWKSLCSRLEASSRSTMENMATASHRGSGLWHWRDLVVLRPSLVRRSSEWVSSSIDCISPSRNAPTEAWRRLMMLSVSGKRAQMTFWPVKRRYAGRLTFKVAAVAVRSICRTVMHNGVRPY